MELTEGNVLYFVLHSYYEKKYAEILTSEKDNIFS